jgi:hypothetical protein
VGIIFGRRLERKTDDEREEDQVKVIKRKENRVVIGMLRIISE